MLTISWVLAERTFMWLRRSSTKRRVAVIPSLRLRSSKCLMIIRKRRWRSKLSFLSFPLDVIPNFSNKLCFDQIDFLWFGWDWTSQPHREFGNSFKGISKYQQRFASPEGMYRSFAENHGGYQVRIKTLYGWHLNLCVLLFCCFPGKGKRKLCRSGTANWRVFSDRSSLAKGRHPWLSTSVRLPRTLMRRCRLSDSALPLCA